MLPSCNAAVLLQFSDVIICKINGATKLQCCFITVLSILLQCYGAAAIRSCHVVVVFDSFNWCIRAS